MPPSTYNIKVAVIGEWSTGKTSLVERMVHGRWKTCQSSTIGCAFYSLRKMSKFGIPVVYQIWDTAGQERYRSLTSMYYRNADIVIICFDLSDIRSYRSIEYWVTQVRENDFRTDRLIYLIANKCDLDWVVSQEELDKVAQQLDLRLVITSAKDNVGIIPFLDMMANGAEIEWRHEILHRTEKKSGKVELTSPSYFNFNNCCSIS